MAMQFRRIALGAGAALLLMPAVSFAQAPPQSKSQAAPPKGVHDPQACADANVTAGKGANGKLGEQKGQTLSDKLARSKGVICPPSHVDPEIKAPTPQGGPMPVIPPPGSPGGNPNVQPK
jgi:hypothetical protein